jgi:phage terminase small subunit
MGKPKGLSAKQRAFVDAYTGPAEGNASEAARIAGYRHPERQGWRLLKNVAAVQQAIDEATAEAKRAAVIDRQKRQELLSEIALGNVTDYHVSKDGVVVETPTLVRDRSRAIELLGKMQGDFIEKLDVKLRDVLEQQLAELERTMSPEAYQELLDALEREGE